MSLVKVLFLMQFKKKTARESYSFMRCCRSSLLPFSPSTFTPVTQKWSITGWGINVQVSLEFGSSTFHTGSVVLMEVLTQCLSSRH